MKDNTLFHCGNSEVKYSCFRGKDRKHYLRETRAGEDRFRMRRIKRVQVDEYFQMQNLEAKINWCASMMKEEGIRFYSLPLSDRVFSRTFIQLDDSLAAGNCEPLSKEFAAEAYQVIGAVGPCAVRADVVLALRDDSWVRAALRKAVLHKF